MFTAPSAIATILVKNLTIHLKCLVFLPPLFSPSTNFISFLLIPKFPLIQSRSHPANSSAILIFLNHVLPCSKPLPTQKSHINVPSIQTQTEYLFDAAPRHLQFCLPRYSCYDYHYYSWCCCVSACLLHNSSPHNIRSSTSKQYTVLPIGYRGSPGIKTASAAGLTGI